MLAGVALFTGHVVMTLTGTSFDSFAGAPVLPGVGWNFFYIGGTTLLTTTYSSAEKGRAQAINGMTIFVVGLACSFSAGALHEALGWEKLNLLPWLAAAAGALVWYGIHRREAAGVGGSGMTTWLICEPLPADGTGRTCPDDLRRAITGNAILTSIMHANDEVGTISRSRTASPLRGHTAFRSTLMRLNQSARSRCAAMGWASICWPMPATSSARPKALALGTFTTAQCWSP